MQEIDKYYIEDFLAKHNYDVRILGNGRWIDQKCTPDVLMIIADCILRYIENKHEMVFSSKDIWHSDYAVRNVLDLFKKPNLQQTDSQNEYDKFFQQPMELLSYAGILNKIKKPENKRINFYQVADKDLLQFLAFRDENSLTFLIAYITKVLNDSGLMGAFENFFNKQTKDAYISIKQHFMEFTVCNTKINGSTECYRIFAKIINPLAYTKNKLGTESGHISKDIITRDMLMYNRKNFRDSKKNKGETRSQYLSRIAQSPEITSQYKYSSQKAKGEVREFNDLYRDGISELLDSHHNNEKATTIHHIFPEAYFPEISGYHENLIALTPTQHYNYAHPMGRMNEVDSNYQHDCLNAKSGIIQQVIDKLKYNQIYKFADFMYVLDIGLDSEVFTQINSGDFVNAVREINLVYLQK